MKPTKMENRKHPKHLLTAWFRNWIISDRKTLQRIVRTAEKIIQFSLPSIMDITTHAAWMTPHTNAPLRHFSPSYSLEEAITVTGPLKPECFFPQATRLFKTHRLDSYPSYNTCLYWGGSHSTRKKPLKHIENIQTLRTQGGGGNQTLTNMANIASITSTTSLMLETETFG